MKTKPSKEEKTEDLLEVVEPELVPEEVIPVSKPSTELQAWKPKTSLGKRVKAGEITSMDEIISSGQKILEAEIVDLLLPGLESELMLIGQAHGKFGGGQRRIFKQTQKKTAEGNQPSFSTMVVVGNRDGLVGLGVGSAKETVPSRDKATRKAKLNMIKVLRGCGSWECGCGKPHSIPFKVTGRCGSVRLTLIPAPKGTGLCVEKECQKLLRLAGITDVWSKTKGTTNTKSNLIKACFDALSKLVEVKLSDDLKARLGIVEGGLPKAAAENGSAKAE